MKLIKILLLETFSLILAFNFLNNAQNLRESDSKQSSKIYSPSISNNLHFDKTNSEVWSPLGPEGITTTDLAVDPLNSNKIIVGGLLGMYITTNGGTNWNIINSMFYNVRISKVKFHPTNSNIVIANGYSYITGTSYIARSIDGGTNWTIVQTTSGLNYGKIIFSKNNPSIVYSEGYYLYRSTDAGATWTEYTNLPNIEEYDVYDLDPNKLYAFSYQSASPYNRELYSSQNAGVSWTKIQNLNNWFNAIKISSNDFNQIYAGSLDRNALGGYGFLKSIDGGNNWTATTTGFGKFSKISFITFHPDNSNIIYTGGSGTSLMRSTNGGVNWTDLMPSIIDRYVYGVQFDTQKNLYVFTGSNIYKSTNETTFQPISGDLVNTDVFQIHFSPTNYSVIYLASLGGVLKTTNGGQTWTPKNNGIYDNDIFSLGINPQNANMIFAGSFGSLVYRTTDGGENWIEKSTGLTGLNGGSIYDFWFHPLNPFNVFLLEGSSKIFLSTNSGDNWTEYKVNNNSESIKSLIISPSSKNIWYAYTASGGKIYKTTDYGTTWNLQGATFNLYDITVDANNPSILYADQYINSVDNISKSTDSGYSWAIYKSSLYVRDIFSVPGTTNTLYASSWGTGVYKTTDAGFNWSQVNNGLTYLNCFMVRNQPGSTSSFLVATYGGGVFGFNYTPTDVKNNILPRQYTLENNYPNPFNPTTTISFTIPKDDYVTLKVYDLLGREIETLVDRQLAAGNYKINFNARNLTSGIYFYNLISKNFYKTNKMSLIK